jgi:hypothetical protein
MNAFRRLSLSMLPALALLLTVPGGTSADGLLGIPTSTQPFGTFRGVAYVQYTGWFEGATVNGSYRVPYRITAPAKPSRGNGTLVVEPPHFAVPDVALAYLGPEFVFDRGFSHAQVGWGTFGYQILDPSALASGEAFIKAGPAICASNLCSGNTDFDIVADFARALRSASEARPLVGRVRQLYSIGASNSTEPLHALLHSEPGQGLFDLSFLITPPFAEHAIPPGGHEPPRGKGRVVLLTSEADVILFNAAALREVNRRHPRYRVYEVAGAPHIPNTWIPERPHPLGNDWTPFLRAVFLRADLWASRGWPPPASVYLHPADEGEIDPAYLFPTGIARDADLNARGGIRAPDLAIGRSRYLAVDFSFAPFFGDVVDLACEPLPDGSARFPTHGAYVRAFVRQVGRLLASGFLLPEDARAAATEAAHSDVGKPGSCP